MKAVIYLIHSLFDGLFSIPLVDTGVSFGHFILALVTFDVMLIVLHHVFRKDPNIGSKPPKQFSGGVKE